MALKLKPKFLGSIVKQELVTGTIDGVNDEFTLSVAPADGEGLMVFVNGRSLAFGSEFTLTNTTITLAVPPAAGQVVHAFFIKG